MALALQLDDAGKRYRKYDDNPLLINAALRWRKGTKRSSIWAVRNVDLTVEQGECVGVIGRNGSGKSTMLQLLAGVSAPTEGRVIVNGRIAPMLAVGVGFNGELTGRENVYLNGQILGLTRQQIDGAFDDILSFSEIEDFIDTPVKFYSSGMAVRLGFAVAAQAQPDVLLLDEVLAVGDIAFQMKCFDRMAEIIGSGATVLLVSHNLGAIRRLCSRALLLHNGVQRFLGRADDALYEYQKALAEDGAAGGASDDTSTIPVIPGVAEILEVRATVDDDGRISIEAVVEMHAPWEQASLAVVLTTKTAVPVYYESSPDIGPLAAGRHTFSAALTKVVAGGEYTITIGLRSLEPLARLDRARPVDITVPSRRGVAGVIDLGGRLRVRAG